jgi:hypothetical protein
VSLPKGAPQMILSTEQCLREHKDHLDWSLPEKEGIKIESIETGFPDRRIARYCPVCIAWRVVQDIKTVRVQVTKLGNYSYRYEQSRVRKPAINGMEPFFYLEVLSDLWVFPRIVGTMDIEFSLAPMKGWYEAEFEGRGPVVPILKGKTWKDNDSAGPCMDFVKGLFELNQDERIDRYWFRFNHTGVLNGKLWMDNTRISKFIRFTQIKYPGSFERLSRLF